MKALGASHITILFHDYAWHRFYIIDCAAHYNYISYAIPVILIFIYIYGHLKSWMLGLPPSIIRKHSQYRNAFPYNAQIKQSTWEARWVWPVLNGISLEFWLLCTILAICLLSCGLAY